MKNKSGPIFATNDVIQIPAMMHPGFRASLAIQNGVERRLLFRTWGGLGDQICAEPTLRYALDQFKNCEVFLESEHPELFTHLKFKEVFDSRVKKADPKDFLVFETITAPDNTNMVWLFFSHMLTHCVDFPSLCALRSQLPIASREVRLPDCGSIVPIDAKKPVVVHAGRHWPSKTFPADWWNSVLNEMIRNGMTPVLIGADTDDNRGTVSVNAEGCIDMRNRLSIVDTISLLKRSKVLITNDSSPLHMAADSDCWIGFIATCKHPDFITHWRRGQWGYRMKNLGLGGMWDTVDMCPNAKEEVTVDRVAPELLASWLPQPAEVAEWTRLKFIE